MEDLENLRKQIDSIDNEIIKKLAERQTIVQKIGEIKSKVGKKILDAKREEELMKYHEKIADIHHLSTTFIHEIFNRIIEESRKMQE